MWEEPLPLSLKSYSAQNYSAYLFLQRNECLIQALSRWVWCQKSSFMLVNNNIPDKWRIPALYYTEAFYTPHTHTHTHSPQLQSGLDLGGEPGDGWRNPSHQQRNFVELNCNFDHFQSGIDFSKTSLPLFTRRTSQIAFCCNIAAQTRNTADGLLKSKHTHTPQRKSLWDYVWSFNTIMV